MEGKVASMEASKAYEARYGRFDRSEVGVSPFHIIRGDF